MIKFLRDIIYKQETPRAINRLVKPKWLDGVSITRHEGFFEVSLWTTGEIIVKDSERLKSIYKVKGSYDKKELNLLGEHTIEYVANIDGLDVAQCFSISKSVLQNRIAKEGTNNELYIKYEEHDIRGILIKECDGIITLSSILDRKDELVVNGIPVYMLLGPDALARRFGKPDIKLVLAKCESYSNDKNVGIDTIVFSWDNSETKYGIILTYNIRSKELIFKIEVH